jgi:hypothetical protein
VPDYLWWGDQPVRGTPTFVRTCPEFGGGEGSHAHRVDQVPSKTTGANPPSSASHGEPVTTLGPHLPPVSVTGDPQTSSVDDSFSDR